MRTNEVILQLMRYDIFFFARWAFSIINPGTPLEATWHIEAILQALLGLKGKDGGRLLINAPPRSCKSSMVSVVFVAWMLGRYPHLRFIVASYNDALAKTLHREFRLIIEHPLYQMAFPAMRINDRKNTETEVVTTRNGSRLATSVDGLLTGRGGDYLVIDDPVNSTDARSMLTHEKVLQWFNSSFITRLNNQMIGRVAVVMQRLHGNDLSGHLRELDEWDKLILPVRNSGAPRTIPLLYGRSYEWKHNEDLMPDRVPRSKQNELEKSGSSADFWAVYMQEPQPAGGILIKTEWPAGRLRPMIRTGHAGKATFIEFHLVVPGQTTVCKP